MRLRTIVAWSLPFLAVGIAFVLGTVIPEGAFFSGDGGLKYLMARQFGRGVLSPEIRLEATEGIMAAWRDGAFPFVPPFVYELWGRHVPAFPPWFSIVTAPALTLFGWWGLFVIPVAAVLWMAWETDRFLRDRVGPAARVLGVAALLLGTPLSLYGAMFWEHTLACALFLAGFTRLIDAARPGQRPSVLPGGLMGLSGWLRPELFVLGALSLVMLRPAILRADAGTNQAGRWRVVRRWDLVVIGMVAAGVFWMLANLLLFRTLTGVHALQVTALDGATRWGIVLAIARSLLSQPFVFGPVMGVAGGLALAGLHPEVRRRFSLAWVLAVIAIVFPVAACFVVPNEGGLQWGPRYLLGAFLPACLSAALLFDAVSSSAARVRVPIRALVVSAVLAGAAVNGGGAKDLFDTYRSRTAPALGWVRDGQGPIVVDNDLTAMEIAHAAGDRPMLRASDPAALRRAKVVLEGEGVYSFLYVASQIGDYFGRTQGLLDGSLGIDCIRLGVADLLVAWTCSVRPPPAL